MFKSVDGGKRWEAINNGMTEGHHHNVDSFALSETHPDVLFRASGEARGHAMVSAVHKTTDGGRTWKLVTDKPDFFGNGATRFYGEKIGVDPFDGGNSWRRLGKGLPFGKDTASVLNAVKADPNRPGWLYAGFIHEGLWRSTDYGESWRKLFPADDRIFNATALAVGGPSGSEVYVASEPLYWSRSESAVYASFDNGVSWTDIYDRSLGALRWKGIDVDNRTGTLYGVTNGNSAYYAERIK